MMLNWLKQSNKTNSADKQDNDVKPSEKTVGQENKSTNVVKKEEKIDEIETKKEEKPIVIKSPKKEEKHDLLTSNKIETVVVKKSLKPEPDSIVVKKEVESKPANPSNESAATILWVDKYKPKSMNKVIGQLGDKSNASKLLNWLKNWNKFHMNASSGGKKAWNDQETGSSFKCALLSGPPGIGKTTTAQLACTEAGYTFVELNASDSRSKKLLDSVLGESTETASIDSYMKGKHKVNDLTHDKHCIIMDEVDGMAGNEDRGGIQQLISIVKSSKIPIICICNDRQHPKIRTLAGYCFDLRFYKPRLEQVRSGLMSVCFKEGIKMSAEVLDQIIIGCNFDIRQCLHNLSMWSSNNKSFASSQKTTADIERAMKDVRMNPFEACRQTFQANDGKTQRTLNDKLELFFTDYSLMPLLIQENYLNIQPVNIDKNSKRDRERYLDSLLTVSESLMNCDRIGGLIRTNNNWSLLTTQAVFTTLIPGETLSGNITMPSFPSWFGKNSKQGRVDRILQELQKHMRIHISANKIGVGMDYLSVLKSMLTKPLIQKGAEGIPRVIELMTEYSLTREDFDTIVELSTWPNQKDVMTMIDSKVKASFTRAYNKESHKNPFSIVNVKKMKAAKLDGGEDEDENYEEADENEENKDDLVDDAMVKVKKTTTTTTAAKKTTASKRAATKSNDPDANDDEPKTTKKRKINKN